MKIHPKSKSKACVPDAFIEHRQLEKCIADYDLLVFDYFATGAVLAIMSDKPIIYFDIGLRRLAPKFAADLINRCEYAKIDLDGDMAEQVRLALAQFRSVGTTRSNAALACYALCEKSSFNWFELFNATAHGTPPPWQ